MSSPANATTEYELDQAKLRWRSIIRASTNTITRLTSRHQATHQAFIENHFRGPPPIGTSKDVGKEYVSYFPKCVYAVHKEQTRDTFVL
jgi:hypothetical protein